MAYLLAGALISLIMTLEMKMVSEKRAVGASFMAFLGTIISVFAVVGIVQDTNTIGAILYAVGVAMGSYAAMVYDKKKLKQFFTRT